VVRDEHHRRVITPAREHRLRAQAPKQARRRVSTADTRVLRRLPVLRVSSGTGSSTTAGDGAGCATRVADPTPEHSSCCGFRDVDESIAVFNTGTRKSGTRVPLISEPFMRADAPQSKGGGTHEVHRVGITRLGLPFTTRFAPAVGHGGDRS